jgi:CHAT domain-containing protein/tetratricopeptide (TPR) repeat protein
VPFFILMKATLTLLVCLVFVWPSQESAQTAQELLNLSADQNLKNHALAAQTAREALAQFQAAGDQAGTADTYSQLGSYYYAQNKMSDAAQNYESSLQIWRQQANLDKEAAALIMLGYIEARNGEWLNGISYLIQAHNLIDDQSDLSKMGQFSAGMGYVFNESGLPENGLVQYQRAMEYYRQAKDTRPFNRQVMMIGYTHFLLKDYPAALTNLQQALSHFESLSDRKSKFDAAECKEYLGQVYIATEQYDLALQHLLPIPPFYLTTANERDAAQVQALIGQIYERLGELDRARANYLEASKVFHNASDRVHDAAVRFALGRLELNRGNYEAAESYLQQSVETTEDIRSDLKSRTFAAAFSASVHDRYEAYIDCLMHKHRQQPSQGFEALALQASELARARSLGELLRDTQTKFSAGVDPRLVEAERALRQSIRAKVDQTIMLLAGDYKTADLNELETVLTSLREQHKLLVDRLRRINPHYDQLDDTAAYSVQQIQHAVVEDDQTTLLEYLLGDSASYVWVITNNDVKVFELPKAAVITEAVRKLYNALATEPDNDTDNTVNDATAELGQMVLGPLANQLSAQRLIVVADRALNYIPFQLLPDPSGSHEPLVAKYEVINAPSATVLGQLRQEKEKRRPRSRILAAFGDPVFASNYAQFKDSTASDLEASRRVSRDVELNADSIDPSTIQPLIYSKFELRNLSDIAGPGSFVARGFDASRGILERTDFSKYSILHFATHGLLDPVKPEHSGFFLSMVDAAGRPQDGFITMRDVYGLHVPVDLVVLSACRTGLGQDVRGEGLIGLTRGFMYAGASSVVASLWKVDDEATAELMKHFYGNMLQMGMRPAEALRAAQNTLRQNPQWRSPHFWAGFTLQGEFKQPITMPVTTSASLAVQNAVGGALLLSLLAGIGWGYWRRTRSV